MNRYIKVGNKYLGQVYGTMRDRFFWIDAEDFKEVSKHSWYYNTKGINDRKSDYGFLRASVNGKSIYMHNFIMGESPDASRPQIDHIDHNTCNNCKENLRFVSNKENSMNRRNKDKT